MDYITDIGRYDVSSIPGKSLYLAHMEIDPIEGLIGHMRMSLEAMNQVYSENIYKAIENGDFKKQESFISEQAAFTSKIIPAAYEAILVILVSRLEESLNTWCRLEAISNNQIPQFEVFRSTERGIDKSASYLKEYTRINIKTDKGWEYITAIRDSRNAIVHNGGRVKDKDVVKLKKYKIGVRDVDNSVYIDLDTINNMYAAVIEFIDRAFSETYLIKE